MRQLEGNLGKHLFGKLFGDKGYLSQPLTNQFLEQDVQLITSLRKNMENRLLLCLTSSCCASAPSSRSLTTS